MTTEFSPALDPKTKANLYKFTSRPIQSNKKTGQSVLGKPKQSDYMARKATGNRQQGLTMAERVQSMQ